MNTASMSLPRQLLVTVDGSTNIANVTRAIRMLRGVTAIRPAKTKAKKPRLYDPETGCYLKDSVVKSIEKAHDDRKHGRLKTYASVDDMFQDLGINA